MDDEKVDYCAKCKDEFPISFLATDRTRKIGYRRICKTCQSKQYKIYREKNRERLLKKRKENYQNNIKPNINNHILNIISRNPIRYKARILKASILNSCKKKKIEYDKNIITIDFIYNLLIKNPKCECCGKIFSYEKKFGKKNEDAPSIDRFNSNLGYIKENISVICWRCNNVKNFASSNDILNIIKYIKKEKCLDE